MQTVIPVLRILDEPKAREFYIDWLGFKLDWEHRFGNNFPLYCQVSLDGIILHLSEHHGDCLPGGRVRIHLKNLPEYHALISAKDYKYYKPGIEKQDWGFFEMNIVDPFGNRILFVEEIKSDREE